MDIFLLGAFLAKPSLPQKTLGIDLDFIVFIAVAVAIILFTVIKLVISYRRNRFCPCCSIKTKIQWRTEKRDPAQGRITLRFGRGTVFQAVPVARCPKCGFEIELGK